NRCRPVLRLLDYAPDQPDPFHISGGAGSRVTLDGLLIVGRGLLVTRPDGDDNENKDDGRDLCELHIRHCTLVPGWSLDTFCEPIHPNEASLEMVRSRTSLCISESIIGTILVASSETQEEPITIEITDSILDATSVDNCALGAPDRPLA